MTRTLCLLRWVLDIISHDTDFLAAMHETDRSHALKLRRVADKILIISKEENEESTQEDRNITIFVTTDEGEQELESLISKENALEVKQLMEEFSKEGISEESFPNLFYYTPQQFLLLIEIVEFIEEQISFRALGDLISKKCEESLLSEEQFPGEKEIWQSWQGFRHLSFSLRRQTLNTLLGMLHHYMLSEVDYCQSIIADRTLRFCEKLQGLNKCDCLLLAEAESLKESLVIVCETLYARYEQAIQLNPDETINDYHFSISKLLDMIPLEFQEHANAVSRACSCKAS